MHSRCARFIRNTRHNTTHFSLFNIQMLSSSEQTTGLFHNFHLFLVLCWFFLDTSLSRIHTQSHTHTASFTTKTETVPCCCRGGSATLAKPRGQLLSRANTSHTHTNTQRNISVFQSTPSSALCGFVFGTQHAFSIETKLQMFRFNVIKFQHNYTGTFSEHFVYTVYL